MCSVEECTAPATHEETHFGQEYPICDYHCTCNTEEGWVIEPLEDQDEMWLSTAKLDTYWERTKNEKKKKKESIDQITIDGSVPEYWRTKLWAAIVKHRRVFESTTQGAKPLAAKGDCDQYGGRPTARLEGWVSGLSFGASRRAKKFNK